MAFPATYSGRVVAVAFRLLECARAPHAEHFGAIDWLDAAAAAFGNILIAEGYFSREEAALFPASVEEMKTDMQNNRVDLFNLTIEDLGVYALGSVPAT